MSCGLQDAEAECVERDEHGCEPRAARECEQACEGDDHHSHRGGYRSPRMARVEQAAGGEADARRKPCGEQYERDGGVRDAADVNQERAHIGVGGVEGCDGKRDRRDDRPVAPGIPRRFIAHVHERRGLAGKRDDDCREHEHRQGGEGDEGNAPPGRVAEPRAGR